MSAGSASLVASCFDPAAWPLSFSYPQTSFEVLPVDPITVAPNAGPPFTPVVVTGTGCVGPDRRVEVWLLQAGDVVPRLLGGVFAAQLESDGAWTARIVIPPLFPDGPVQVEARCSATVSRAFDDTLVFPAASFEVVGSRVATIDVAGPVRRAPVGEAWYLPLGGPGRVTFSGSECSYPGGAVLRWNLDRFVSHGERDNYNPVSNGELVARGTGTWEAVIDVPTDLVSPNYRFRASCTASTGEPAPSFGYGMQYVYVHNAITVDAPRSGAIVSSPVRVRGRVFGSLGLRIEVRDDTGSVLGSTSVPDPHEYTYAREPFPAELSEFDLTIAFTSPASALGVVTVCESPSACSPADLTIPVRFSPFTG